MSFSRMFTYRVLTERCHTVVRRHTVYYCRSSPDIGHQQAFEVSFKWKLHITIVSHVLLFSTFVPHFSNTNTAACRILAEIFTVFCFCCPRSSWSGLTTSVHKFNFDHFQLWVTPFFPSCSGLRDYGALERHTHATYLGADTLINKNVACVSKLCTKILPGINNWSDVWHTMINCCPPTWRQNGRSQRILRKALIAWNQQHKSIRCVREN